MILPMPDGWTLIDEHGNGGRWAHRGLGLIAIMDTNDEHGDGRTWYHLSVSQAKRVPNWEELKAAKEAFLGDRYAVQVFPPKRHWVNINPRVLHLWATDDGEWPLPEFGRLGTL